MDAKLIVVGGKASKGEISLKLPMTIGRSREAELTIAHPMISRRHCELFEADGLLMIRDLDSLNGTLVAGRRIKESPLPPDGEFTIGPLTFRARYQYEGDIDALPEAVPAEPAPSPHQLPAAWSDSPPADSGGEAVAPDQMTESTAAAEQAPVELAFLDEIQGEPSAAVGEKQPPVAAEEAPDAKPPADKPSPQAGEEFDIDEFLDGLK
ncbi:MAG: FHA domain-containing protein [Pirellulales bacterium]|nr:FHA domain-containing protein [Pirellulales bacterium]